MKRLAIFVEGQTEQIFVRRLLEEIAGNCKLFGEHASYKFKKLWINIKTLQLLLFYQGEWPVMNVPLQVQF